MLQEHSFFSRPSIFFGSPQNESEEELNASDACCVILQTDLPFHRQSNTGLFIYWSDLQDILITE